MILISTQQISFVSLYFNCFDQLLLGSTNPFLMKKIKTMILLSMQSGMTINVQRNKLKRFIRTNQPDK